MRSLNSFTFLLGESARNVRRNGLMSLAALSTVIIAMTVLGGALFTLYRLHQFAEAQPRQFEIAVFMRYGLDRDKTEENLRRIGQLPEVESVTLYSKEQAWKENNPLYGTAKDALDQNPLSDSLQVRVRDPKQTANVSALLADSSQYPDIEAVRDAHDELTKLFAMGRLVRNVGGGAAILLFLATALVIQNTIRLTVHARRKEIRVMQLVGATPGFIKLPMVLEGIFYGAAGAAAAAGLVVLAAHQVSVYSSQFHSPLSQSMPPSVDPLILIGAMAACGGIVGWLGSALSIRRFLRRI
jgi:cell division transport system permease protein